MPSTRCGASRARQLCVADHAAAALAGAVAPAHRAAAPAHAISVSDAPFPCRRRPVLTNHARCPFALASQEGNGQDFVELLMLTSKNPAVSHLVLELTNAVLARSGYPGGPAVLRQQVCWWRPGGASGGGGLAHTPCWQAWTCSWNATASAVHPTSLLGGPRHIYMSLTSEMCPVLAGAVQCGLHTVQYVQRLRLWTRQDVPHAQTVSPLPLLSMLHD